MLRARVLALHGFGGTFGCGGGWDALPALARGLLARDMEVHFAAPRAPNRTEDGSGVAWLAGDQRPAGKVVGFSMTYEVLRKQASCSDAPAPRVLAEEDLPTLSAEDNIWVGVEGFDRSLQLLEREWGEGQFDGVLGFSQGALMAAMLCARLRDRYPRALQPKFAVLCGGFARPWPAAASPWWPPRAPLDTPSLHAIGELDTIVAPCRSDELRDVFADPLQHRHGLIGEPRGYGGHVVPWPGEGGDDAFYDALAGLLKATCAASAAPATP